MPPTTEDLMKANRSRSWLLRSVSLEEGILDEIEQLFKDKFGPALTAVYKKDRERRLCYVSPVLRPGATKRDNAKYCVAEIFMEKEIALSEAQELLKDKYFDDSSVTPLVANIEHIREYVKEPNV